ncbi:MAG: hypothetical protein ACTS4Y_00625 [Candidatus Hodgkinia cicadicola]
MSNLPILRRVALNNLTVAYLSVTDSRFGESGVRDRLWLRYAQRSLGYAVVIHLLLGHIATYYNGIIFGVLPHSVRLTGYNHFVKVGSPLGGGRYDGFCKTFHLRRSVGCPFGLSGSDDCVSTLRRPFTSTPPSTCFHIFKPIHCSRRGFTLRLPRKSLI